jgi:mannose-6-phosphate isomerase-like protein (cupin superfamily)
MRALALAFAGALLSSQVLAQTPATPPAPKAFTSAAEVQAIIEKSRAARKNEPNISTPLLVGSGQRANLEYRGSAGPAAVHPGESEAFYVIEGAGVMTTGGKIVGQAGVGAGPTIEGGSARRIAKGDWILVAPGEPHQVTAVDGSVVLMSVHLK